MNPECYHNVRGSNYKNGKFANYLHWSKNS